MRPVKTSASEPIAMAVNINWQATARITMWVRRVLACPVRDDQDDWRLRIKGATD